MLFRSDEWLLTGLSGLKIQLDSWQSAVGEIATKEGELQVGDQVVAGHRIEWEKYRKLEAKAESKVKQIEARIKACEQRSQVALQGRSLAELQVELQTRREQKVRAALVASLEEHRAQLHPGEECPLCGS